MPIDDAVFQKHLFFSSSPCTKLLLFCFLLLVVCILELASVHVLDLALDAMTQGSISLSSIKARMFDTAQELHQKQRLLLMAVFRAVDNT